MIGTIKTMAQNKFQPNKSEEMDYVEEPWTLIGSYFKNKHLQQLVRHQLESYNEFITTQLPKTIDMFNPIHIVSEQDYMEKYDKETLGFVHDYTDGVNAYINQLDPMNYPVEYKLLDYSPEKWTPKK